MSKNKMIDYKNLLDIYRIEAIASPDKEVRKKARKIVQRCKKILKGESG